jgi:hypothetical protein
LHRSSAAQVPFAIHWPPTHKSGAAEAFPAHASSPGELHAQPATPTAPVPGGVHAAALGL